MASNIAAAAKEEWLEKYRGATLTLEPVFGNHKVNHMFSRNFDVMGRNAFFISVRSRILLGEEKVALAEKHVYDRLDEVITKMDNEIKQAQAVMANNGIDTMASYNKPTTHKAKIVSPIQTRYLKLLSKADELLMFISTLMLHGVIPERDHSKQELKVKHYMRVVPSAVRKVTIGMRIQLQAMADADKSGKDVKSDVKANPETVAPAEASADAPVAANEAAPVAVAA